MSRSRLRDSLGDRRSGRCRRARDCVLDYGAEQRVDRSRVIGGDGGATTIALRVVPGHH